jgi:cell division septum initiation protein DivIVA
VSDGSSQWPAALQEMFTARQRAIPVRVRGYDRQEVDQALERAGARLGAAVDECAPLVDLVSALDQGLEKARARLAEYDRLHAGEAVRQAEDEATREVVEQAERDAEAVVGDAHGEARRAVERAESAVADKLRELEDAEREGRWRLAMATSLARDVLQEARKGCADLLTRLVGRQQEANGWGREFSPLLDALPSFHGTVEIPRSRQPEDAVATRVRTPVENPAAGGPG